MAYPWARIETIIFGFDAAPRLGFKIHSSGGSRDIQIQMAIIMYLLEVIRDTTILRDIIIQWLGLNPDFIITDMIIHF